jgi:hypothetical protein
MPKYVSFELFDHRVKQAVSCRDVAGLNRLILERQEKLRESMIAIRHLVMQLDDEVSLISWALNIIKWPREIVPLPNPKKRRRKAVK